MKIISCSWVVTCGHADRSGKCNRCIFAALGFEYVWQVVGKLPDAKFHENMFSSLELSQSDGPTDTEMVKLMGGLLQLYMSNAIEM